VFAQDYTPKGLPKSLPVSEYTQEAKVISVQNQKVASPNTAAITDTIDYYGNKFYFLTPQNATSYSLRSYEVAGGKDAAGNISYAFTRFVNGVSLNINTVGVRLFNFSSNPVNVTYSLCTLDASGYPVFPATATATSVVTSTAVATVWANFNPPVTYTSNFAIVAGVTSGAPSSSNADSVGVVLYRAASIPTNTTGVTSWTCTPYNFFDQNNFLRSGGNNYLTQYSAYDKFQWEMKFGVSTSATANYTIAATSASCAPITYSYTNTSQSIFGSPVFNFNRFVASFTTSLGTCIDGTPFNATNFPYEPVYSFNPGNGSPVLTASTSAVSYTATYNAGPQTNYLAGRYRTSWSGRLISDIATKSFTVAACTGVNELTENDFVVYPNPTNGIVNIKNLNYNSSIELYNILGDLIYKEKVTAESTILDLSKYNAGNYFLKVTTTEGTTITKKLILN